MTPEDRHIFHDPTGKRERRAKLILGIVISLVAALVAGFVATLAFAPRLPDAPLRDPHVLTALHQETPRKTKPVTSWKRVPRPKAAPNGAAARPLSVGFYVDWDQDSRESLRRNIDKLDVVSPQWVAIKGAGGDIVVNDDPEGAARIANAPNHPAVLPLVHNSANAEFNGPLGDALLSDPQARAKLIANLKDLAAQRGFGGYVFDFEALSDKGLAAYPKFLTEARAALQPAGREVWVTAPFDEQGWPLKRLEQASDTLVLMAYDQHYAGGDPGPNAGQDWYQAELAKRFASLDPTRTVLALAAYGYDWTLNKDGSRASGAPATFHEAMRNAQDAGATIRMDPDVLNPTYDYTDDNGDNHVVWFMDAVTLFNQVKVTDPWRPRGYALWRMGMEDPGVWSLLGKPYGQASTSGLMTLANGQGVDFDGGGEVLRVAALPTPGKRSLQVDPATGLVSNETYDVIPSSYVVERYGQRKGMVALTFDDGPDGRWTPKILDILKEKHAPATFFVIGQNMQRRPDIVQREVAEGHNVGGHTWTHPNIGETPLPQVQVELNATQRLFEVLTGRSMRLFRPPFFGDAEPSTPHEVAPLVIAQTLGYTTVGLRIDPDDWKKPAPQEIIDRTLDRLDNPGDRPGQVVLLHDAGGDRNHTIEALPGLIDAIRARGYKLVTIGELAGMTPEQAMPPTSRNALDLAIDRLGFDFFRWTQTGMGALFILAIFLGVARLVFLASLALVHRFWTHEEPADLDSANGPLVSVLIPCFNEEKVIAASVARILESDWKNLEVLVLDDGSKDRTADEVRKHFADDPRVTLLSFENGGKARAVNRGLAVAKGEYVVALDADTLFPRETIGRLARWFQDPDIGAVAGNAIVGNRVNIVTRWQALEYVTAQNLERRALSALGAVTVVPGAVGAWRKSVLDALGGYPADTLAEDQDLTIACQRAGWKVAFDPEARAYTEAPDTVGGLLKQRFRWSFGTLQCVWKHRAAMFSAKAPVLGFVALPQIWLFQIILAVAAPLVDLAVVWSLISGLYGAIAHPVEWRPDDMLLGLTYWAIFIAVDLSAGALGMALEKKAPWADLPFLPVQRFGYRQLMYYVVVKSVVMAVRGGRVGWGKLERRATVSVASDG
ncbi:glycosyltransferase [Caulobacter segnis]|uniref:Chitooligosaccharide deacetylase n=1 Tax=Caulobacter segnis TaxID=88688 RepID=A0A2W5V0G6_9CAUL|nr:glycosyltransferase [Caulobacter segnis]PZR32742.1 MAG: polysaccharide deacetylase [Caulobacter segnis]